MRPGKLPSSHKFYNVWVNMKARCNNPSHEVYYRYGGRGIKYCDRWAAFSCFYDDMFLSWADGLVLDRIDIDWDYCPENCRWVTRIESGRSSSRVKLTMGKADEIRKLSSVGISQVQLARRFKVTRFAIYSVLRGETWA